MPIVVATANAVYQYLKTGKAPEFQSMIWWLAARVARRLGSAGEARSMSAPELLAIRMTC